MKLVAWCLLMLLAAIVLGSRLLAGVDVISDIRELLPNQQLNAAERQALEQLQQQNLSRHLLLLGHPQREALDQASRDVLGRLEASPFQALAPNAEDPLAWQQQHPYLFLAESDRALTAPELVARAMQRLFGLTALSSGSDVSGDPFGVLASWRAEQQAASALQPRGACLYRQQDQQHWCLIPLQARDGGLHLQANQQRVEFLRQLRQDLNQQWPALQLLESGLSHHAAHAAQTAQREFSRISLGTGLGITLLLLLLLRSLWPLLQSGLMLAAGALCGLSACLLVYPQAHLIALVFGACLLGVAVDYAFHFFTAPGSGPERLARIGAGLRLGWLSTSAGFACLLLAPFDSLRQVALFGVCGLAGAWLTVHCLLPQWPSRWLASARPGLMLTLSRRWPAASRPRLGVLLPLLAVLLLSLWQSRALQASENVRALHASSAHWLQQDQQTRQRLDGLDAAQLFIVRGASGEQMLQSSEALQRALEAAREHGQLRRSMSLSQSLPSAQQQQQALAHWQQLLFAPGAAMDQLQQQLGLPDSWREAQQQDFARQQPITLERWSQQPGMFQTLLISGDTPSSLVRLGGVQDLSALQQIAERLQAQGHRVSFFDPLASASQGLATARDQAVRWLSLALLLILLLLINRYGLAQGLISALPLLLALSGSLAVLALRAQPFNLFAVFALLLVLGMAIDYGVFLREAGSDAAHSLLAVTASALTTLLAFGLLGFSSTPALREFGQIVALGISLAWLSSVLLYRGGWMKGAP